MKNYLVSAGIALLVVVAGFALFGSKTVVKNVVPRPPLGAIPGNHVESDTFDVNGLSHFYKRVGLGTATTTVCSFTSPVATSSLLHWSVTNTVATSVATILYVAQSTTSNNSTTTLIAPALSVGANVKIATSSDSRLAPISPSTNINFNLKGGNGTTDNLSGACSGEFLIY